MFRGGWRAKKGLTAAFIVGVMLLSLIPTLSREASASEQITIEPGQTVWITASKDLLPEHNPQDVVYELPFFSSHDWSYASSYGIGAGASSGSNFLSGAISVFASAFVGGATAEAVQYVRFSSGANAKIIVKAKITYVGGATTIGPGAWAGTEKVWFINGEYHRKDIDPAFGFDDIVWKIVEIASFASTYAGLAGIQAATKAGRIAVEAFDTISSATSMANALKQLVEAGHAKEEYISFLFITSEDAIHDIGIGFRANASGAALGSGFSIMGGQVEWVKITAIPIEVDGYWNFEPNSHVQGEGFNNLIDNTYGFATIQGTTVIDSGIDGQGFYFDSTNYIKINYSEDARKVLAQTGVFEAWVKPDEVKDAHIIYAAKDGNDGFGNQREIHLSIRDEGDFCFYIGSDKANGVELKLTGGSYNVGEWYHVAAFYENIYYLRAALFVKGERVAYGSRDKTAEISQLDTVRLGRPMASTRRFVGAMDEVRIYTASYSEAEDLIKQHYWEGVDDTPPTPPEITDLPEFYSGSDVLVTWSPSTDDESGVAAYQVQCASDENFNNVTSEADGIGSLSYLFEELEDGTYYFRVRARDRVGNESNWSEVKSTTIDSSSPEGSFEIKDAVQIGNKKYIRGEDEDGLLRLTLGLSAEDDLSGVIDYQVNIIPDPEGNPDEDEWTTWRFDPEGTSSFTEINTERPFSIPREEGERTIWVRYIDKAGNASVVYSDTVVVDLTPPTGSITINEDAKFTNELNVTLTLSASDPPIGNYNGSGVVEMRLRNDNEDWKVWETYNPIKEDWSLSEGEGTKTVYVQFRDRVGNVSPVYSDTIAYWTPPAVDGWVKIDGDAEWTSNVTSVEGEVRGRVSLKLHFESDKELSYLDVRIWNGNESEELASWISLAWSEDEVNGKFIYETTRQSWHLEPGEGEREVNVRFRYRTIHDQEGIWPPEWGPPASDTIKVDYTPPYGSIIINDNAPATNSRRVTLTLSPDDDYSGMGQMRFRNWYLDEDGKWASEEWSGWENCSQTKTWLLAEGEGPRVVEVQWKDVAGNLSPEGYAIGDHLYGGWIDHIRLDITPPTGEIKINQDAIATNSTSVTLSLSAIDNFSGVTKMRFGNGRKSELLLTYDLRAFYPSDVLGGLKIQLAETETGLITPEDRTLFFKRPSRDRLVEEWSDWEDYSPTKQWELPSGEGFKTVYVQFMDAAGNVSMLYSDGIYLDTTPPTGEVLINNDDPETNSRQVELKLPASDNLTGVTEMQFSKWPLDRPVEKYAHLTFGPWEDYSPTKPYDFQWGEGMRGVAVRFKDAAGNISQIFSDFIILDPMFSKSSLPGRFNDVVLADINNDGWLDLLATELKKPPFGLKLFINSDGEFIPVEGSIAEDIYRAALGDLDNDGDLDIVAVPHSSDSLLRIFLNEGEGRFKEERKFVEGMDTRHYSYEVALGDIDNDGDLDLFSATPGETRIYVNTGEASFDFKGSLPIPARSFALGDIDNDGDIDLLVGYRKSSEELSIKIYLNEGEGSLSFSAELPPFADPLSQRFPMDLVDVDGDRDLDLVVGGFNKFRVRMYGEEREEHFWVWVNNGEGEFSPPEVWAQLEWGNWRSIAEADLDNDGGLDLVTNLSGEVKVYFSEGMPDPGWILGSFLGPPSYGISYACPSLPFSTRGIALGDIDNDGDLDMIIGELRALRMWFGGERIDTRGFPEFHDPEFPSCMILENTKSLTKPNSPPSPPANLQLSIRGNQVILSWEAGSDAETPSSFLTYNVRVGTTPGGGEIVSGATAPGPGNVGTSLQKVLKLKPGIYYWSVQTVDAGFARSEWAVEQSFTLAVPVPGDVDGDGVVDAADLGLVAAAFGSTSESPDWNPSADLNGDGVVDIFDLVLVGRNFGS